MTASILGGLFVWAIYSIIDAMFNREVKWDKTIRYIEGETDENSFMPKL